MPLIMSPLSKRFSPCLSAACLALVWGLPLAGTTSADLIRLRTGGELRGQIVEPAQSAKSKKSDSVESSPVSPSPTVVLRTEFGATITLDRRDIHFISRRSPLMEDYETKLRETPAEPEAVFALGEWCRKSGLKEQAAERYEQVLELDELHEQAHRALGHEWSQGRWVDRDAEMEARGYVKHKGKYITPQELELIEKTAAEMAAEQEWFKKVRLWAGWAQGRVAGRQQEGWQALQGITDANAAPAITKFLGEDPRRELRLLAVQSLSQMSGAKPVAGLVRISLMDPDNDVRYGARQGLRPEQFEHAMALYLKELRSQQNVIVCRAALGLGRVGDDRAINPLITALTTQHRYNVRVPGSSSPSYSFSNDGNVGGTPGISLPPDVEAGLRTGQYPNGVIVLNDNPARRAMTRTVVVNYVHENVEVRDALRKLTGSDFGYDERTWRLWWTAEQNQGTLSAQQADS